MSNRSIEVEATLRLALEALKNLTEGHSIGGKKLGVNAITAIKAALEAHKALSTKCVAQPERDLKPRCFADFQPNHELDRKCQWCAVETECKTGMSQPKEPAVPQGHKQSTTCGEPVAYIDEQGTLRYYKPSDFNQCKYGGLICLYKEKT